MTSATPNAIDRLRDALAAACSQDPRNLLEGGDGARIYDSPLVGVADAHDPLYEALKDPAVIGPFHLSPPEWLAGARSVVSYFLPFSLAVRRANRGQGMVAPEWVTARFDGEAFNNVLRAELASWLREAGGEVIVPPLTPRYAVTARRSNWSERHTAFIAGLGTFGLSKSMITEHGAAGRFGSVIASLVLPPSTRSYAGVYDRCPWLADGRCGACIERCPSGAITAAGKDVAVCSNYLDNVIRPLFSPRYGCGKCQTAVPCEAGIPGAGVGVLHVPGK